MPQADTIVRVLAREVLDSRGRPTVETEVHCHGGVWGRAIVPSGASTGKHEAVELRDCDRTRYRGLGVRRAISNIRQVLAPLVVGVSAGEQERIDQLLCDADGTANKSRLGANAVLGVSLACAHAAAAVRQLPLWRYLDRDGKAQLPLPMVNLISGGLHAGGNLDFQDFLLLPVGARSFRESLELTVEVYRTLGEVLSAAGLEACLVADEGGYGPRLRDNEQAVELILRAICRTGLSPGKDAALAVDVASTHFYREGRYQLRSTSSPLTSDEMVDLLRRWVEAYPIWSIEDGVAEDDWDGWKALTAALGHTVQLIGDDLFVTNPARLQHGIAMGVANAVLIKLNQIGTLTETMAVIRQAHAADYRCIVSARSGETEDTTLADLAVATGVGQIKIGSVTRSERLAKYNQLLRIEEQLNRDARFTALRFRKVGVVSGQPNSVEE